MSTKQTPFGAHLLTAARAVLYGFVFLFPLFFLPFTLDVIEINKQSLLLLASCLIALVFLGSVLTNGFVRVRLKWLHVIPLLLIIAFAISAWFSLSSYTSWIGSMGSEYTSVLTLTGLVILFFAIINLAEAHEVQKKISHLLLGSALFVAVFGTLSIFGKGLFPFLPTSVATLFNPIGTPTLFALLLIIFSMFGGSFWLSQKNRLTTASVFLLHAFTLTVLLALDYSLLWFFEMIGCVILFVIAFLQTKNAIATTKVFPLMILATISILFWAWLPSPFTINLPVEVSLNTRSSFEIVKNVWSDHSFVYGTGSGTYAFDYARYHGANINETNFWNTRFDRASSLVLTFLPTVGILGTGFFVAFFVCLFVMAILRLRRISSKDEWLRTVSVFVPWFLMVIATGFFPFNMALMTTLFVFSGLLVAQLNHTEKHLTFGETRIMTIFSSVLFGAFALAFFVGIFFTTERYAAEIAYAKAIRADRANDELKDIVANLDRAATLNRFEDDYYRALSQALFLRVQEELKGVSSQGELSEQSRIYLEALVAASVNASVHATELSPYDVSNWLTRGEVYRSLVGLVNNATTFSIEAYKKAIERESLNPNNWVELGKTQLIIADAAQALTVVKDAVASAKATQDVVKATEEARQAFEKAIELKANFAPAHFQLGRVYEREGKLDEAVGKFESVARYNTSDAGVAYELGMLYLKRNKEGDLDRARNALSQVVTLVPTHSNAHWYLASMYEKSGDRARAIKEIEAVLKLNPDNQLVKTRLDKLKAGE